MKILTQDEFRDALQKGLGRTILYVKEYGAEEVQDDILHACLYNLAYDPQIEGHRVRYLFSLMDLTKNDQFYCQRILEALADVSNDWDEYQLLTLLRGFAQRGDEAAREALYAKFKEKQVSDYWSASEQIIELDGLEGLLYVVEKLGARLLREPDFTENNYMIAEAYERFGEETVTAALLERAESSDNVRAYLDKVVHNKETTVRPSSRRRLELTFDNILSQIEVGSQQSRRYYYITVGRDASEEDIEPLFTGLLAETRTEQLLRYLWLFTKRTVPRLDKRLFELAMSENEALQKAAIGVIANIQDPSVHDFALQLLEEQPHSIYRDAIELFVKNYQAGDYQSIEMILDNGNDPEAIHSLGLDLINLAEKQSYQELENCLLWVYEHTPCAYCRSNVVKILIERNLASEALLLECLWDAFDETRDLAEAALSNKGDVPPE
jgi:hypothetical protein